MFSLFSPLTSKLFAGLSGVLTVVLIYTMVADNRKIANLERDLEDAVARTVALRLDNATLRTNQSALEQAVASCSASVEIAAAKATQAAAAGSAALSEARKNTDRVTAAVEGIQAMPAATCADAEAILRQGARP